MGVRFILPLLCLLLRQQHTQLPSVLVAAAQKRKTLEDQTERQVQHLVRLHVMVAAEEVLVNPQPEIPTQETAAVALVWLTQAAV